MKYQLKKKLCKNATEGDGILGISTHDIYFP